MYFKFWLLKNFNAFGVFGSPSTMTSLFRCYVESCELCVDGEKYHQEWEEMLREIRLHGTRILLASESYHGTNHWHRNHIWSRRSGTCNSSCNLLTFNPLHDLSTFKLLLQFWSFSCCLNVALVLPVRFVFLPPYKFFSRKRKKVEKELSWKL